MSKMRNRWLALGLAFLMAFPTNGVIAFAGQENAEVAAVSANDAEAEVDASAEETSDAPELEADGQAKEADDVILEEDTDLDAEEALIRSAYPIELGKETELTALPVNGAYYVTVTIPEGTDYTYYRLTVDGQQPGHVSAYTSQDLTGGSYGDNIGILHLSAGTYWIRVTNDENRVHKVCFKESDLQSISAKKQSDVKLYEGGSYSNYVIVDCYDFTLSYADGTQNLVKGSYFSYSFNYMDENGNYASFYDLKAGDHKAKVSAYGKETEVAFTVYSSDLTKIELCDKTRRTYYEDGSNYSWLAEDTAFTVTEKGVEKQYTYATLNKKYGVTYGVPYKWNNETGQYDVASVENADLFTASLSDIVSYEKITDQKDLTAYVKCCGVTCELPICVVANRVESVSVSTLPVNTVIEEGTSDFSFAGLVLKVTYRDGTSKQLSYDKNELSSSACEEGYDLRDRGLYQDTTYMGYNLAVLAPGSYSYKAAYAGKEFNIPITIVASDVEKLELTGEAIRIKEGYSFYDGMPQTVQLRIWKKDQTSAVKTYNKWIQGSAYSEAIYREEYGTDQISIDGSEVNTDKTGGYTIYIDRAGKLAEANVDVIENDVESIQIVSEGLRTVFAEGEDTYLSNTPITITYADGTKEEDSAGLPSIYYTDQYGNRTSTNWVGNLPIGKYEAKVTAYGKKASYTIQIVESPVEKVELISGNVQKRYAGCSNTSYMMQDMVLRVTYTDKETKEFTLGNSYTMPEDDKYPSGQLSVRWKNPVIDGETYELYELPVGTYQAEMVVYGKTVPYTIQVDELPIESVSLDMPEEYTSYFEGESVFLSPWNFSKATVTIKYTNGAKDNVLSLGDVGYEYYDDNLQGDISCSYTLQDEQGKTLGNTTANLKPGTYKFVITGWNRKIETPITITESPVDSISLDVPKNYLTYVEGSNYNIVPWNLPGTKITVNYNNGAEAKTYTFNGMSTIDDAVIGRTVNVSSGLLDQNGAAVTMGSALKAGTYTMEVSYLGKKASVPISIIENPVESFTVTPPKQYTSYTQGDFSWLQNGKGYKIAVTYKDGTTGNFRTGYDGWLDTKYSQNRQYLNLYIKKEDGTTTSNINELEPGIYDVTVGAYGLTATYPIEVKPSPYKELRPVLKENYRFIEGSTSLISDAVSSIQVVLDTGKTKTIELYETSIYLMGEDEDDEYRNSVAGLEAGEYTAYVAYKNLKTTFTFEVVENPVESIEAVPDAAHSKYLAGAYHYLGTEGMTLKVHYKDAKIGTKVLKLDGENSWYDADYPGNAVSVSQYIEYGEGGSGSISSDLPAGQYTITVSAYGRKSTYPVTLEEPQVEKISLQTANWQKQYYANSSDTVTYNIKDILVTLPGGVTKTLYDIVYTEQNGMTYQTADGAAYLNALSATIKGADGTESAYSFKGIKPGTATVTISLCGKTASYTVDAIESPLKEMKIAEGSKQFTYLSGQSYSSNVDGLKLQLVYKDGTTKTVDLADCWDEEDATYTLDGRTFEIETYDPEEEDEVPSITVTYYDKQVEIPFEKLDITKLKNVSVSMNSVNITEITENTPYVIYKLQPEETMTYSLYSRGNYDTEAYLYNTDGSRMARNDDGNDEDDNMNFRIEEELEAGGTYYLLSRMLSAGEYGSFMTVITGEDELEDSQKEKIEAVKLTVPEPVSGEKKAENVDIGIGDADHFAVYDVNWSSNSDYDYEYQSSAYGAGLDYTATLYVMPVNGYRFTSQTAVSVNGKKPKSRMINADGNLVITYTFTAKNYQVSYTDQAENYQIKPDAKTDIVEKGGSYGFTVTPSGNVTLTVKANGTVIKPDTANGTHYTISDIQKNTVITVTVGKPKPVAESILLSYYNGNELYDEVSVFKGSTVYRSTIEKDLPKLPSYTDDKNQFFLGWYMADGTRLTRNTTLTADTKVTAKWTNGIFEKTSSGVTISYKILSVSDSGKLYVEIIAAKSGSGIESNLLSLFGDLFDADGASAGEVEIPANMQIEGLEADVVAVSSGAFKNNTELKKITLPKTVETIGANAFAGCSNLTDVKLPGTLKEIGAGAFENSAIETIALPDSLEQIGENAFSKDGQTATKVFCSSALNADLGEAIKNAGGDITRMDITINTEEDPLPIELGQTQTVSANAVLDDTNDVSDEITWSVDQEDQAYITVSPTTGKEVQITAKEMPENGVATVTANCKGVSKELQIAVRKIEADSSAFDVTLDQESYTYEGKVIEPKVTSVTYEGEKLDPSEYTVKMAEEDYELYIYFTKYAPDGNDYLVVPYKVIYPPVKEIKLNKTAVSLTVGDSLQLEAACLPDYAENTEVMWLTSDKAVLSQTNMHGLFKAEKAGVATVTVKAADGSGVTAKCVVTINEKPAATHTCTFDNGRITKQPTCTQAGEKTYTCTGCGRTKVEAIAMTAHEWADKIVKASPQKGGYTAKACKNCGTETEVKDIYAPAEVVLSKEIYVYNKKACKPSVKVKDSAGNEIAAVNYDVAYADNKKIGNAKVTVTFKGGQYEGSLTKTFTIASAPTKVSKAKAAKKSIKLTWKKQKKNVSGYQIQYSTSKNFDKAVKTKTVKGAKKTSLTISKLKAKKTYYVRIRTYKTIKGKKYCSAWSKAKKVKTK